MEVRAELHNLGGLLKVTRVQTEGPGAEALGKDLTPLRTTCSDRMIGDGTGS